MTLRSLLVRREALNCNTAQARGTTQNIELGHSLRLTFFHSAATCLHVPGGQNRHFKRSPAGSAGGPANGTWSAAVKSWPARISRPRPFPRKNAAKEWDRR